MKSLLIVIVFSFAAFAQSPESAKSAPVLSGAMSRRLHKDQIDIVKETLAAKDEAIAALKSQVQALQYQIEAMQHQEKADEHSRKANAAGVVFGNEISSAMEEDGVKDASKWSIDPDTLELKAKR